jgi:hypothetical protein
LKIGNTLGIGTALVQRVVMEQPRPFDVDVAEAALAIKARDFREGFAGTAAYALARRGAAPAVETR